MLVDITKNISRNVYHIEDPSQLKRNWFIDKKKIGIATGTSTPLWLVKEVVGAIKKYEKNKS